LAHVEIDGNDCVCARFDGFLFQVVKSQLPQAPESVGNSSGRSAFGDHFELGPNVVGRSCYFGSDYSDCARHAIALNMMSRREDYVVNLGLALFLF
jgi:hypothetical protein